MGLDMKHTVVMCIGSRRGGDDAIGPYIADRLLKKQNNDIVVLDCGIAPESYTSLVKKYNPKYLLIIDAVDMGLKPGETRIIPIEKISEIQMHISTHNIPLSILVRYLCRYVKNIIFIGIQPKTLSGEMTPAVRKSGDRIVDLIIKNEVRIPGAIGVFQ